MQFADNYFKRYKTYNYKVQKPPSGLLKYIVVIPVYLEDKLKETLQSLVSAKQPEGDVEIILVFNHSEADSQSNKNENKKHYNVIQPWLKEVSDEQRFFLSVWAKDLPRKFAGPGLARKIGMDIALERFNHINQPDGFILSLDADALVDKNYFTALEEQVSRDGSAGGCIYYFEHDIDGDIYSPEVYKAAIQYELHLRYYKHALHQTGFPYSNYTIGSCFGVKAQVYAKHGGMNRQQAGEDFYFLSKLFPHERFLEISNSCVRPSPRPSERVVFGTGPVIKELAAMQAPVYCTYNPQAFSDLKQLFDIADELFSAPNTWKERIQTPVLLQFLEQNSFEQKLEEIRRNTASAKAFQKRFFAWFDGFRVVKFLNVAHLKTYSKVPAADAAQGLLKQSRLSAKELLLRLREIDRGNY